MPLPIPESGHEAPSSAEEDKAPVSASRSAQVSAPPPSKTAFVYEWLKEEILSGSLGPGSRIRQQQVADALGVSFTPVREAIRQLQATGLLTHESNRGSAVSVLAPAAVQELYMLRGAMEGLAARLAAKAITPNDVDELRAIQDEMMRLATQCAADSPIDNVTANQLAALSRQFHGVIVATGGPVIIEDKVAELWNHYPVPRSQSLWHSIEHASGAIVAHGAILDALAVGDASKAGKLMEGHIIDASHFRVG